MKLNILAFLLLFTCGLNTCALQLKGYVGAAETYGDMTATSSSGRIQFRLGGLVEYPIAKSVWVSGGLGLSQRGSTLTHALVTVTEDRIFLDIPLLLTYDFQIVQVYGGANLATRLSSKCKISDPTLSCADNNSKWLVAQPVLGIESQEFHDFRIGLFYEWPVEYQKNWNQYSVGLSVSKAFGSSE